MKLWQEKNNYNKEILEYTIGNDCLVDQKIIKYDCIASIAHAKMLNKINILSKKEEEKIIKNLKKIKKLNENGKFILKKEDEDCHTAIEKYLTKKLGKTGKKIHTARSRNDQILVALRLYYKEEIKKVKLNINQLIKTLEKYKEKNGSIKIPGYTHTRKGMPSSIGLLIESYIESMQDNKKILKNTYDLINQSPLGTGAGYGLPIKYDRKFTSDLLGFKKIQNNPIYVQNSRGKFESEIIHMLSQVMLDLNKIANDLILFSTTEFGFFNISDKITTGSSIMPHKKNPDALELIRAKYSVIISYEQRIKNIISNLISGYHRDLQLTKEPIIKSFEITINSLKMTELIFQNLEINKKKCKEAITKELYSTEEVYNILKKDMTFRDAYFCISQKYK